MTTTPGRSANQTAPKAISPTTARKRRTRIIEWQSSGMGSRYVLQRSDGVGGDAPAGVERLVARFHPRDPVLERRAGVGGKLGKLGGRAGHIALGGALSGTRKNG